MTDSFHISLLTPKENLLSTEVEMIVIPGSSGEFGVLASHAPVISSIKNGVIQTTGRKEGDVPIFVSGGFVEVTPDGCTILAEKAVDISKISRQEVEGDVEKYKRALARDLPETEKNKIQEELAIEELLLEAVIEYA